MRPAFLTSLLLVVATVLFAQTPRIDSLERSVEQLRGNRKVLAMNELCSFYLQYDTTKAEKIAKEATRFAKSIGDRKDLIWGYNNLGKFHLQKKEYLPALDAYHKSLEISMKLNDETDQAESKKQLGKIVFCLSDYGQAEYELEGALALFNKNGIDAGKAETHDLLGKVLEAKQDFAKAKIHFNESLRIWDTLKDFKNAENAAENAAKAAFQMGDNLDAKSLAFIALEFTKKTQNKDSEAAILLLLANIYLQQNELDEAEVANQSSFNLHLGLSNNLGLAENNLVFGETALARGERDAAIDYFEKTKQLLDKQAFTKEKVSLLSRLMTAYIQIGDLHKASFIAKNALESAQTLAANEVAEFRKTRHQLLIDRLGFAGQEDKIAHLETLNSNNNKIRSLLFILMGLAGLLSAVVYVFYRKNLKDNQQLQAQNEEILQQKGVFDDLNKELGIKNLSLEMLNKKLVEEIAEREKIERSSFARDRFLATMSHEMRTPLNVITGLTYLLLDNSPRPDQVEQLRSLQFASNELVVFINDVLDFSKIEAGKIELQSREFNLGETADAVFNNFVKKAEAKKLLFYCSFDSQIPRKLIGDDARFYQILNNLLNICLESTADGMIRAELFLDEQASNSVMVRLVVESTDGGMELTKFVNLQQLNEEENANPRQLSLAITKRLVELQHGRMDIQNVYGEATRFTVLIPFKKAFSFENNIIQLGLNDHAHLRGSHILVVDDNKINQLVVSKMLNKHGVSVLTADNGFAALEQVELHDFDLILMDIQMPEMDGYRATSEIRKLSSPAKRTVPIIALTSSAFLTEKEKAVLFGMNDHVGKPFSPEELIDKISACLVPKH